MGPKAANDGQEGVGEGGVRGEGVRGPKGGGGERGRTGGRHSRPTATWSAPKPRMQSNGRESTRGASLWSARVFSWSTMSPQQLRGLLRARAGGRALLVIQELAPHAGGELEAAEEAAEEAEDSEEHGGADDNRYDHLRSRVHAGLLRWERELSGEGVGREGALAHAVDVDVAWGVEQDARDSALTILLLPHRTRFALALPPVGLAERRRISDPWRVQPSLCRATSAGPGIPALGLWWRTATGRGRSRRRSCPW